MQNNFFKFTTAVILIFSFAFLLFGQTVKKGAIIENLDRECEACEDFYRFANGSWFDKTEIPAAYPSWGGIQMLHQRNQDILRQILEENAEKDSPKGSNAQKVGDFFASCMNLERIEAEGAKPLEPFFERIENIKDKNDLIKETARLHNQSVGVLFGFGAVPDFKNSSQIIAGLGQGGLSLPDRDYYLKGDEKSKQTRQRYLEHMARMFVLLGENEQKAKTIAETVLKIETELARNSMDNVTLRNPNANYHKMPLGEVEKLAPEINWNEYFKIRGAKGFSEINVAQPEFFKALNKALNEFSIDEWKTYLRWHAFDFVAGYLPRRFADANFDFYSRYLTGAKEQLSRTKQCVAQTNGHLGEALGQEYVKAAFPPAAKAKVNEMIDNLMAIMQRDVRTLDWMSDATKQEALAKLSAFRRKIGYPDKWRDYSQLKIERGLHLNNVLSSIKFNVRRNLNKIGKPVDRDEWFMTPPTVNAYYNSFNVEIVFPAGILQPPFFNFEADDAINYGAIGAVIGHEITHGFDDKGRMFDARGNLRDWWTAEDARRYEERAACVEKQFSMLKVADDLNVNGKLVLGEAIGDLGGLRLAYEAYQKSLEGKPKPPVISEFTAAQRFFLGFAQASAVKARPEFERYITQNDSHPLPRFRVNATLANMPEFAEAFSCKIGDKMVRSEKERCRVW